MQPQPVPLTTVGEAEFEYVVAWVGAVVSRSSVPVTRVGKAPVAYELKQNSQRTVYESKFQYYWEDSQVSVSSEPVLRRALTNQEATKLVVRQSIVPTQTQSHTTYRLSWTHSLLTAAACRWYAARARGVIEMILQTRNNLYLVVFEGFTNATWESQELVIQAQFYSLALIRTVAWKHDAKKKRDVVPIPLKPLAKSFKKGRGKQSGVKVKSASPFKPLEKLLEGVRTGLGKRLYPNEKDPTMLSVEQLDLSPMEKGKLCDIPLYQFLPMSAKGLTEFTYFLCRLFTPVPTAGDGDCALSSVIGLHVMVHLKKEKRWSTGTRELLGRFLSTTSDETLTGYKLSVRQELMTLASLPTVTGNECLLSAGLGHSWLADDIVPCRKKGKWLDLQFFSLLTLILDRPVVVITQGVAGRSVHNWFPWQSSHPPAELSPMSTKCNLVFYGPQARYRSNLHDYIGREGEKALFVRHGPFSGDSSRSNHYDLLTFPLPDDPDDPLRRMWQAKPVKKRGTKVTTTLASVPISCGQASNPTLSQDMLTSIARFKGHLNAALTYFKTVCCRSFFVFT